jgi:formamidopyrimidine-DNA glycosylase
MCLFTNMPELGEVDYFRRRWNVALGERIDHILLRAGARPFRGADPGLIGKTLQGRALRSSESAGKQMLFRFGKDAWLGLHLGMSGELDARPPGFKPGPHDKLVLYTRRHALVYNDPRMFGRVLFAVGPEAPAWWTSIAPALTSRQFSEEAVAKFLRRRSRAPVKSLLLMQERFPGIGNWMADEILWRAAIHPRRLGGSLSASETKALWRECRWVARQALRIVGKEHRRPPASWLFPHRWQDGGRCPRTGALLMREQIGGRTTCWSPGRQKLPR